MYNDNQRDFYEGVGSDILKGMIVIAIAILIVFGLGFWLGTIYAG